MFIHQQQNNTKKYIFSGIFFLYVLGGCNHPAQEPHTSTALLDSTSQEHEWTYITVKQNSIDSLINNICSEQGFEFIDLYPPLDSIASDPYENLTLVNALQKKGFQITNWGRGNWMEGPRIVNFTMSNSQCECHIDKLYYSTDQKGSYRVTERIKCLETVSH